jgi:hypothetical protein
MTEELCEVMISRPFAPVIKEGRGWFEYEYLYPRPTSLRRRQKGNPVPGIITGPPCSWGI